MNIKRRMIAQQIVKPDNFKMMPRSTKYFYLLLVIGADDVGIVDDIRTIMNDADATREDCKLLIAKGYIIAVGNGIYAISDWAIHNNTKQAWFKGAESTLYQDIFAKLNWKPNTRYHYTPELDVDINKDNENILKKEYPKVISVANSEEIQTGEDVIHEMDQIIAVLSSYGISQNSSKGRLIAETYSFSAVANGINYAQKNMPENCENPSGWIIKCIEIQGNHLVKCPNCHGSGQIKTIQIDPDKDDGSMCYYQSACPKCKGFGFVK